MSVPILMYHQICAVPPHDNPLRGLCVDPDTFASQMAWLRRFGYQGLSMCELQLYFRAPGRAKVFGITFDDGFQNVFDHAMPVLDSVGFTATCYFVADHLGGTNHWDAHLAPSPAPLMDRDRLLTWMRRGHEVGAHTLNHVSLPDLTLDDAAAEIVGAKHQLESICGTNIEAFCYPYGNVTRHVRDIVERAGYRNATTTRRGRVDRDDDPFLLPRLAVAPDVGPFRLLFKCLAS
ncbi:polysaccharide deacetylase family protein [Pandoraea sputorum]|uniref:polysaccharide deacetylase family protein n=1 Tax=Pandoraea sputorum TaxID=93222 RepID=UPI001E5555CC|nr:polysaccharide deacetylase family protein [Pandoraea sputorum]MCE4062155.1 polysaccharide deacetylase family protein [Pandoraea sputorum]